MVDQILLSRFSIARSFIIAFLLLFPLKLYASFIEATIGTAVVNDATAAYYNPAGLTLFKNPQLITLGSVAHFHSQFTGQFTQAATGFTQNGNSNTQTDYYLPSVYLGLPMTNNKVNVGLAILANAFNNESEENSILRYVQSNNSTRNIDFVPAVGIKLNEYVSLGAGINISYAKFISEPLIGFPSLNIPDSQSHNESSDTTWGGDVGFIVKPSKTTLIGFNYRSCMTYLLSGKSVLEGSPGITSNNYHFTFWTPARSVISISQSVTPTLGFIATVQRIQWSIFNNINIHGIATKIGNRPIIVPNAVVPYHFHNTWIFTLGSQHRINPKWVVRLAGSYIQSPSNGNYQISNGDNIVLGASMAYDITKNVILDGSYSHTFIKNQTINIVDRSLITGVNKGLRDAISLKLTFNLA